MESAVSVYQKNEFGFWEIVDDPFKIDVNAGSGFGKSVGLEGDLACVGDINDKLYLFRRKDSKWKHRETVDGGKKCWISGDTMAIHRFDPTVGKQSLQIHQYNRNQDEFAHQQDQTIYASVGWVALNQDYLIYSDISEDAVLVYHREGANKTFAFHQRLSISLPKPLYGSQYNYDSLDLASDSLLIGGVDHTSIYTEEQGVWKEVIMMDQSYNSYQLNGADLVAADDNSVYHMNIEGCAPTPTQVPSMSNAPTTCYEIELTVVYDNVPCETSWELRKIGSNKDEPVVLEKYQGTYGNSASMEQRCLQEGTYEFAIYDTEGNGLMGGAHYNITSLDGSFISGKGDFKYSDTARFFIPLGRTLTPSFSRTPSLAPSATNFPSVKSSVSIIPTQSAAPTKSFRPTYMPDLSSFGYNYTGSLWTDSMWYYPPGSPGCYDQLELITASVEECAAKCSKEGAWHGEFWAWGGNQCYCNFDKVDICKEPCLEKVDQGFSFSTIPAEDIKYCEGSYCDKDWFYNGCEEFCDNLAAHDDTNYDKKKSCKSNAQENEPT